MSSTWSVPSANRRQVYNYAASETFWKAFYALPAPQKLSVREKWDIFRRDPFDRRLGTHKIHSLSARYGRTIYSVVIEGDLRAVFYIDGGTVLTIDLGTHAIYR